MPRGDQTGPEGKGPKSGREMGFCSPEKKSTEEFKKILEQESEDDILTHAKETVASALRTVRALLNKFK